MTLPSYTSKTMAYSYSLIKYLVTGFFLLLAVLPLPAQAVYFFRDSNQPGYYDSGLAFKTAPSEVAQAGPSGDKIPVNHDTPAYQGNNSLRLTWTSRPGGDWLALAIAPGFPFQNISQSDVLSFWVYSETGLDDALLPLIYMEGAPGATKSNKYALAPFTDDIPPQQWVEIQVPLSVFFNDPTQTNIQFTQIKAIIFGQDTADQTQHTLLIDEIKTFDSATLNDPLSRPAGLTATGYDSHVSLSWNPNPEPQLAGYRIYLSDNGGATFQLRRFAGPADTSFNDFVGRDRALQFRISAVNGAGGESVYSDTVAATTTTFTDEELMTMVQQATFRYFWDFAHPVSGMIRERNTSGNLVTTGGSGFGVMAMLVGIERGFISYEAGRDRLLTMTDFLATADRFHGAWPHWMNGTTGEVIPFSALDDGGDIVETAFMIQGLLAARQYFSSASPQDSLLRAGITRLWEEVEWDWYRRLTNNVLYWHWSPTHTWAINFALRGYNETLIAYLLAIASPSHGVPASLYHTGWAGGSYLNGNSYYGFPLAVGPPRGGPLFFAHYSFMGFDPRYKRDDYANYFEHNYHHSLINRAYCIDNPEGHSGYSAVSWGLTASDNPFGYLAHEPQPSQDNGTIAPTAALGSMPYTPEFSMDALKHFYRDRGHRLWGPMGFYDAFNDNEAWVAASYLAIDQGPIINMIENHRTQLLWDLFMANPEIQTALDAIGFVPDSTPVSIEGVGEKVAEFSVFPNPAAASAAVTFHLPYAQPLSLDLLDMQGRVIAVFENRNIFPAGAHSLQIPLGDVPGGWYLLRLQTAEFRTLRKLWVQK